VFWLSWITDFIEAITPIVVSAQMQKITKAKTIFRFIVSSGIAVPGPRRMIVFAEKMRATAIRYDNHKDGSVRWRTKKGFDRKIAEQPRDIANDDGCHASSMGFAIQPMSAVGAMLSLLSPIGIYALGNCVAVNAERRRGMSDPLLVASVSFLNIELLKFFERLVKHNVAVEHVFN